MDLRASRFLSLPILALLAASPGCGPGVTLTRAVPAAYNLGAIRTLALVDARGPTRAADRFVSALSTEERSRGFYEVVDARRYRVRTKDLVLDRRRADDLLAEVKAEVYFEVRLTGCSSRLSSEVVKEKDKDGNEVTRTKYWYKAECTAQLDMVDFRGAELASFEVTGHHQSIRSNTSDSWREQETLDSAVNDAASKAAAEFTPRRVTEEIPLEKEAPLAKEGIAAIEAGRTEEARRLWEGGLTGSPSSAPLRYNLGAVCEALGDTAAARKSYEEAIRLAPGNEKYREALSTLERRVRDAEALRRRR